MYLVSILCESEATQPARRSARLTSFRRYAAGIAAALLVGFAGNYAFFAHRLNGWAEQQTVIEAPAGQHVRISLNDGSEVDLNSGSRFDVSHNEKQPFVVETFAYDVQVLGTDFNVIADEAKGQFSTALFEGRVSIHNHRNSERIVMEPNTVVRLENGYLYVDKLESREEYFWTECILSVLDALPIFTLSREKRFVRRDCRKIAEILQCRDRNPVRCTSEGNLRTPQNPYLGRNRTCLTNIATRL